MKRLSLALVLVSCFSSLAAWDKYENIHYKATCNKINKVIILLPGANLDPQHRTAFSMLLKDTRWGNTITSWLHDCALVAIPESGIINYGEGEIESWDFEKGSSDIKEVIETTKLAYSFGVPVILAGGSAGALMAYAVAVEIKDTKYLSGLVLIDGISSYSVASGLKYKESNLGFEGSWPIPTVFAYSTEDFILPDKYKKEFISDLAYVSEDLTIIKSGTGHQVSTYGMAKITRWIRNY